MTEKIKARNEAPIHKMKPSRFHLGESRIRYWYVIPEVSTPYEALFDPIYWDAVKHKLAIGDFIRVEPDEGHYTADLKVTSSGFGGIQVAEFYKKDWQKVEMPKKLSSLYETKYAGPHHKWRVERVADGAIMEKGFESDAEANKWLSVNVKALADDVRLQEAS